MTGPSKPIAGRPDAVQALEAVREIVREGSVRRGLDGEAVCGVVPELYVEPANDEEFSAVLRYASESELLVAPRGGGSALDWGTAPEAVDLMLSTARLNRILEYAPHDMTVTVGAGVTIAELQRTLAGHGQRLALDPLWPERATVGGVIATNESGALRLRYGSIRDLLIGITVVLSEGTVAVSGGKVVKNVAGYDLPKLMAGSLGTLGVIVRAVFRLHPLPESSETRTWDFADYTAANDFILRIADSLVVPSGLQMRCGASEPVQVDLRVEGIAAGIAAQFETARKLAGDARMTMCEDDRATQQSERTTAGAALWRAREQLWAGADSANTAILKLSVVPTHIAAAAGFISANLRDAQWKLLMHSTGLGTLRIDSPDPAWIAQFISALRVFVAESQGSAVVLHAGSEARRNIIVWGEPGSALPLMRHVKQHFDPKAILNRGRIVGGI